jgi:hypothetical protein
MITTKTQAIKEFNGVNNLKKALGLKSVQAIYQWPEELSRAKQDRIALAVLRKKDMEDTNK